MSIYQVQARVATLRTLTGDPEKFHSAEDDLYLDVLRSIASGTAEDAAKLAFEALQSADIKAPRWSA